MFSTSRRKEMAEEQEEFRKKFDEYSFYGENNPPVDMVNHPPHYNSTIECIDAMSAMTENAVVSPHAAYCWQAAFKYVWRWPYKGKSVQDIDKAIWYLTRLKEEIK